MNPDFVDLLRALSAADAKYLVVGAYALAVHARPRATGDLDIWVEPTPENAARVRRALAAFGAPVEQVSISDLTTPGLVFQIGIVPRRIDILTSIDAVSFEDGWADRVSQPIEGLPVPFLGRASLIRNKRAVGRPQDLADVALLESSDDSRDR